jgi:hypothetical protein
MAMKWTYSFRERTSNGFEYEPILSPSLIASLPPAPPTPSQIPNPSSTACEVLKRISAVQEENLKRLEDDIDILKAYLKTQRAPKVAIEALEGLTVEHHMSWKKAVERIKKLLDE